MHLMFFIEIAQPNKLERGLIIAAQLMFWHFYLVLYLISPRTAHMMTHYFEEEAVKSYTEYLDLIYREEIEDVPAPQLAIEYYGMDADARLSNMVQHIRADEQKHSKVNLEYANVLR